MTQDPAELHPAVIGTHLQAGFAVSESKRFSSKLQRKLTFDRVVTSNCNLHMLHAHIQSSRRSFRIAVRPEAMLKQSQTDPMGRRFDPAAPGRPLLTIAIPTYNRAAYLKALLTLLAEQVRAEPKVELIISDNSSPDDTPTVVQEFINRGVLIRYIRNTENIGADANFLQCFEEARGKYIWLFSDDDLILPGALHKIVQYCEAGHYDLIWLSSYGFDSSHVPHPLEPGGRDAVELTSPRAYVTRVHIFFTFISGNIINKDAVLAAARKPFSSLLGTSLQQLAWVYTALNGFRRGLYIREKLAAIRMNNTGGYKLFQVFGSTLSSITQTWVDSKELQQLVVNGAVQRFWPNMLFEYKKIGKAFADKSPPEDVLTPLFKHNLRYWIFAYPVIVLPFSLAKLWVFGVRLINSLDKALGYPILQWGVPLNGSGRNQVPPADGESQCAHD